jgi:hypothetical protein
MSRLIYAPISLGEWYDKWSILDIKRRRITDTAKLAHVERERGELAEVDNLVQAGVSNEWFEKILAVNEQLWDIEDRIRIKERHQEFDQEFIELARSVYKVNDQRAEIKYAINQAYGSAVVEVKSYESYQGEDPDPDPDTVETSLPPKTAYFLSHNGLGDNLYSIGALRYLTKFYDTVYFMCKDFFIDILRALLADEPRIVCVPIDHTREYAHCQEILSDKYTENNDVFVCGYQRSTIPEKITNPAFLLHTYEETSKHYTFSHDTLDEHNYAFIRQFYHDARLDYRVFFDYFHVQKSAASAQLRDKVSQYRLIFLQTHASNGNRLNIDRLKRTYLDDESVLLICNDENLYANTPHYIQFELCEHFVQKNLADYVDVIQHADEIYMIDSCFVGFVLPWLKTGKLRARTVRIIRRALTDEITF